jgi:acyl-CoA synthetase (AMP-forming)/AMP-acid ligase II
MVVRDFEPAGVMQTIERESISFTSLVSTMAWMILQSPALDQYNRGFLRGVSFIGAPLPIPVLEGVWQRITPDVYEYYGLQDAGFIACITPEVKREKPGSCGAAAPLTDIIVVDNDGKEVPQGEIGEVLIRTVSSPGGYYKEVEKTKETFKGGWMHTKDLGKLDGDGYLYLVGRKSEMIISGGQNIFATEVEEVLLSHPEIADIAVVGLPDEKWGEAVTAVVVLKQNVEIVEEDVITYCRERLAEYKVPKGVIFTDSIPRTPTGKVRKFILVERYSAR